MTCTKFPQESDSKEPLRVQILYTLSVRLSLHRNSRSLSVLGGLRATTRMQHNGMDRRTIYIYRSYDQKSVKCIFDSHCTLEAGVLPLLQ